MRFEFLAEFGDVTGNRHREGIGQHADRRSSHFFADIQQEFVNNRHMYRLDRLTNTLNVTPIMSWREADFVAAYADAADKVFAQRSPLERAVIAFITPHLLPSEKDFVTKNEFKMAFIDMDWRLNDLTGGRGELKQGAGWHRREAAAPSAK